MLMLSSVWMTQQAAAGCDDLLIPIDSACVFMTKDGTVCRNKICSDKQEIIDLFLLFANAKTERFAIPYDENAAGLQSRSRLIADLLDIQDGELLEDIVYMSNISARSEIGNGIRLLVCDMWYYLSAEEEAAVRPFVEDIVLEQITDDMDDYEKAYALCAWISRHASYGSCDHNSNRHSRSPYGIFIENRATCIGFAGAVKYLLDMAGVPCKIIHSESHAWNAIRIDGTWYYTDLSSGWRFLKGQETFENMGHSRPIDRYEDFAAEVSRSDYRR